MTPEHGIHLYYDWDGNPFDTLEQFGDYFDKISDRTVARTSMAMPSGTEWTVYTCWTGIDAPCLGQSHDEPLIFTTIICRGVGTSAIIVKAASAAQAQANHDAIVNDILTVHPGVVVTPTAAP